MQNYFYCRQCKNDKSVDLDAVNSAHFEKLKFCQTCYFFVGQDTHYFILVFCTLMKFDIIYIQDFNLFYFLHFETDILKISKYRAPWSPSSVWTFRLISTYNGRTLIFWSYKADIRSMVLESGCSQDVQFGRMIRRKMIDTRGKIRKGRKRPNTNELTMEKVIRGPPTLAR